MNITRKRLFHILKSHAYIAVRWSSGIVTGANCRIAIMGYKKFPANDAETDIIGFYPISFQEYIRIKTPIIKTNE